MFESVLAKLCQLFFYSSFIFKERLRLIRGTHNDAPLPLTFLHFVLIVQALILPRTDPDKEERPDENGREPAVGAVAVISGGGGRTWQRWCTRGNICSTTSRSAYCEQMWPHISLGYAMQMPFVLLFASKSQIERSLLRSCCAAVHTLCFPCPINSLYWRAPTPFRQTLKI